MSQDGWDEGDEGETTAIVNLSELRSAGAITGAKDHHLFVHVQGTELGRVRELTAETILMGRSAEANLWLGDDGVSRKHARLIKGENGYVIEDLKSANGTFVQGERITRCELNDGDQIQLGPSAIFRYSITDDDQKALLEQLYSTSVTDSLTGARNREYLDTLLKTELSYARRHNHDLSFVLFDLDHFKNLNDTHGHPAGDAALVGVADVVRSQLRAEDALCRYGGEEFCVVLRSVNLEGAHILGERIRKVLESTVIEHEGKALKITTSVGCATLTELSDPSPAALISLADKRLYRAKAGGRNQVVSKS